MDGSIETYQNTTEGAEIFFRCNTGFVPAENMTAVCGADQRWSPDPDTLVCTCECPYTACLYTADEACYWPKGRKGDMVC